MIELRSVSIETRPDEWDSVDLGEYVPSLPPLQPFGSPERQVPWWAIIDRKVRGDWHEGSHEARWYIGPWQNYAGTKDNCARRYVSQDYARMEAGQRGEWYPEYVYAEAKIVANGTVQTIRSMGIGGIESDGGLEYNQDIAWEELDNLHDTLEEMGVPLDKWAELAGATGVGYKVEAA